MAAPLRTVVPRLPASAIWLSALALLGAAVASIATLAWDGSFPAPSPVTGFNSVLAEARGWSLVTLFTVPIGAWVVLYARRGSLRARLLLAGVSAYLVYTYLELAVSGPFTPLYLVHIATFACALPVLVMTTATLDGTEVERRLGTTSARRVLVVYCLVVASGLAAAWLRSIARRSLEHRFGWPSQLDSVAQVVQALDLGLQVPLLLATSITLLRKRPAGPVLGGVTITMCTLMAAALTAMVAWSAVISGQSLLAAAPFAVLWMTSLALAVACLRHPTLALARRPRHAAPWTAGSPHDLDANDHAIP